MPVARRTALLGSADLVAFVPSRDLARSASFYGEILGLELLEDISIALVFDANGTSLRVTLVDQLLPAPYTVLGWSVGDLRETIRMLSDRGVTFERFPNMNQDDLGVWTSPGGGRVAWFKDPDGNVLSLTETIAAPD
jgi:catechol 2,3-dioxygenase-like lactoylglutathione lyase family enzyme